MNLIYQLRQELHQHIHNYHVLAQPTITDECYDQLFKELQTLEANFPSFADPNSPTARVGSQSIDSFEKVKHCVAMLSLENTFAAEEVVSYFKTKIRNPDGPEGVVEPKIDGLSMSLIYKDGQLIKAVTRGDGTTGDDVTANARTIKTIPLTPNFSGEVRGEVYMPKKQFNRLNAKLEKEGEELFANPRNAAAGSMKRKNPADVAERGLAFLAYNVVKSDYLGMADADTQHERLKQLHALGFMTPLVSGVPIVNLFDIDQVKQAIESWSSDRSKLDYEIDGLVFKINDLQLQTKLGLNNRAPNWATSYKFPPEQKVTKLIGITVQVGRLGTLTPVAELQPVNLAGTIVKRASLHNADEIQRLRLNIGDDVIIQKAAEIIPQVVGVANKRSTGVWSMPDRCPCCNSVVSRLINKVAIVCTARMCKDQVFARLEHAVKKQSLDIDGCGEQSIRAMVDRGINNLSDLFAADDLSFLGDAASKRVASGLKKAKTAPLWRKLHALGIDGIGLTTCKELSNRWNSLPDMLDNMEEIAKFLGPITFFNFRLYFENDDNMTELEKLVSLGVTFEDEKKSGPFVGKAFCITGGMLSGSREEVAAKIESLGGSVKSSVSKKVHYLVVGEGAGANKSANAKKLGTSCISEKELYDMMGLPMEIRMADNFEG
jgi:DNA ligase (NAD+)